MRELAGAFPGEQDAVGRAQAHGLPVDVGAVGGELAVVVGEGLPGVDIGRAILHGGVAGDVVEHRHRVGEVRVLGDRHADPDQRDVLLLEGRVDRRDAVGVDAPPVVGADLVGLAVLGDRLLVVGADHHHRDVDLVLAGEQRVDRLRPVVIAEVDEAARPFALVDDRDVLAVGQRVVEPVGEELAERIAEYVDEDGGVLLLWRRLVGHGRRVARRGALRLRLGLRSAARPSARGIAGRAVCVAGIARLLLLLEEAAAAEQAAEPALRRRRVGGGEREEQGAGETRGVPRTSLERATYHPTGIARGRRAAKSGVTAPPAARCR